MIYYKDIDTGVIHSECDLMFRFGDHAHNRNLIKCNFFGEKLMAQYTVKKAELNKFKFGNVVLEGFESDQKAKWGFNTGQKNVMPPCQAGDLIEADLGENNKGYPTISNIKVVGKSDVNPTPKYKGQEFRTPDQNMRTDAVNLAMTNIGELTPVEEIILMADEFFDYIKNGNSPVNVGTTSKATGLAANQMPEDVPPFP